MIFIAFAAITDTFRCHKMWAISRYSSFYFVIISCFFKK